MKRLLALPGVFLPYNDTITILSYKHLRTLDYDMDVLAMHTKNDDSMFEDLTQDSMYKKFSISYAGEYEYALITGTNHNLRKVYKNIKKYVRQAVTLSNIKNYDVLYSSSLPNFSHLAAYKVKKKHPNIIWSASFSDAIKNTPFQKYYAKTYKGIRTKLAYFVSRFVNENARYQAIAFKAADVLVFVSEEQRDFMTRGKKKLLRKSIIVPFTYIKEWSIYQKVIEQQNTPCNKPKRILHLGNVYGLRRIECLVEGIKLAKSIMPNLHEHIQIEHYGVMEQKQRDIIRQSGVSDVFKDYERIPYEKTMQIMNEADVLLMLDVFVAENEPQPYMPSKFIEYFLTNKLILSIANKNSPIYRQLKNTEHISVSVEPQQIAQALIDIIQRHCYVKNKFELFENAYVIGNTLKKEIEKHDEN